MKKYSWVLALILALTMAFVFVACKNDTTPPTPPDTGEELTPFVIEVVKNQYSEGQDELKGNQAKLSFSEINDILGISLAKPNANDKYSFSITFTPDEDGTPDKEGTSLSVALIADSEADSWWAEIGAWSDVEGASVGDNTTYLNIAEVKKGTEISFSGTLTVTAAPKGNSVIIAFGMEAQPWTKPVNLKVTAFEFKKI